MEFISTGSAWEPFIDGVIGTEVAPGNSLAAYTQVGYAAPDVVSVQGGCVFLEKASHSSTNSILGYEAPKAGSQTCTVHVRVTNIAISGQGAVLIWVRDTTSSAFTFPVLGIQMSSALNYAEIITQSWATLATLNGAGVAIQNSPGTDEVWLRIQDNGTSQLLSFSIDGVNFNLIQTFTNNLRGNVFGFGLNPASAPTMMTIDSFNIQ